MSDALDRYTRASQGFETRLRGVAPDQWTASTPCEEWDVRTLATHRFFGPRLDAPDDADAQTRLLRFGGRRP